MKIEGIKIGNSSPAPLLTLIVGPSEEAKEALEDLRQRGYNLEIFMVSHASLERVWERYKDLSYSFETKSGALDISNDEIVEMTKKVRSLVDVKKLIEEAVKRAEANGRRTVQSRDL